MADCIKLPVSDLVSRARTALSVRGSDVACAAGTGMTERKGRGRGMRCYKCNKLGHSANECRSVSGVSSVSRAREPLRCYACQELGHVAKFCPKSSGNDMGEASSVLEVSPRIQ